MTRTKVQSELIATNAISGTIIADNAITATHIATNAISGTLVQSSGITTDMIASNNVTAAKIVTNAIQTRHIADDQVTGDKLTNNITIAGTLTSTGAFTSPGIDDNADAVAITIDSNENVGIGETSPTRRLSVKKDTGITSGFNDISEFLDSTLGAGGSISLNIGKAASNKNLGKMAFKYAGNSSTSNALNFGFFDADNLVTLLASGSVGIGIASPANYSNYTTLNLGQGGTGSILQLDGSTSGHYHLVQNNNGAMIISADQGNAVGSTTMNFLTDGTERMRIDSSGDLNIVNTGQASLNYTTDGSSDYARITGGKSGSGVGDLRFFTYSGGIAERMRIDSSGNVGIGTNSPAAALDVNVTGSTDAVNITGNNVTDFNFVADPPEFNLEDTSSTSGTKRARITVNDNQFQIQGLADNDADVTQYILYGNLSNGNVSIGTLTPAAKLHVVGSEVLFDNTSGDFTLKLNTNAVGDKNEIIMGDSGTPLAKFGVGGTANDIITGSDGQDFNIGTAGGGRAINFSTDNFASVEMKLDGGNLSIGNTNSNTIVTINEGGSVISGGNAINGSTMKGLTLRDTNNTNSSLGLWFGTNGAHWSGISGQRTDSASTWGTHLAFYTHEDATSDLTYTRERMRITSSGRVGIGTSSPGTELQVGDYSDNSEQITIATASDQTGRINFYNNNNTEGASIRVTGGGNGAKMYFANRYDSDTDRVTFDLVNGRVGIGATSPAEKIHTYNTSAEHWLFENGTSGTTGKIYIKTSDNSDQSKYIMMSSYWTEIGVHNNEGLRVRGSDGNIKLTLTGAAGNLSVAGSGSDRNFKKDIEDIDTAIDIVKAAKPKTFEFIKHVKRKAAGFIAQDMQEILPDLVSGEEYDEEIESSGLGFDYIGYTAYLTKAIQEQQELIETLQTKVAALEAK